MPIALDTLLAKVPGATDIQQKLNELRAKFLAIPQTNEANKQTLTRIRALTNDAGEVDRITQLQAQARAVDSGFQAIVSQFAAFDDLKRSGAGAAQLVTSGASLLSAVQSVQRNSDAVTNGVRPLAQKYGQSVATTQDVSVGKGMVIFGVGALALVFLLGRKSKRR